MAATMSFWRAVISLSVFVLLTSLAVSTFASAKVDDQQQQQQQQEVIVEPIKNEFTFKQFKTTFNKQYTSLVEEIKRQKIFLVNMFKSAISKIRYRSKQSESYLSVNEMSDWTVDEWRSTLIQPDDYMNFRRGDLEEPTESEESEKPRRPRKPRKPRKPREDRSEERNHLKSLIRFVNNKLVDISIWRPEYNPDLPDEVFVDHRRMSNCLNAVKKQKGCGSCYIFSTTALYEWAFCKLYGQKVKFSEQYVIDCGSPKYLAGCEGGIENQVAKFVKKSGFETLDVYNYVARNEQCPYVNKYRKQALTHRFELDRPELRQVAFNDIAEQLEITPVILTIYVGDDFSHYGGGVDSGSGCESRGGLHSVLLVGHGRENGHEYWIIRNSYGRSWGERGYYRLLKDSRCYLFMDYGQTLAALHFNSLGPEIARALKETSGEMKDFDLYNFVENPYYAKDVIRNLHFQLRMIRILGRDRNSATLPTISEEDVAN